MNKILAPLILLVVVQACTPTKEDYLLENRYDLNDSAFLFPQDKFKIIGFGAYHGSSKTEDAEISLISSLTKNGSIKYYLPETDFSLAHYFNQYLETGDTTLLIDLVDIYGNRVPQERSIQMYQKWKKLKKLNDQLDPEDQLTVVGIDLQVNYKYAARHILELLAPASHQQPSVQSIDHMVALDTTDFALGDLSYAYQVLQDFVADYEANQPTFDRHVTRTEEFKHLINNLKVSFDLQAYGPKRDSIMYANYLSLDRLYDFKKQPQFLRMGFSHIEKAREGETGRAYFFAQLLESGLYHRDEVITIIGYLTKSHVLWDHTYDDEGNYTGYTIEGGFGIGDYEKEYFLGIQKLKDAKISDKTLFRLNQTNSPYQENQPDLIEIVMTDDSSNGEAVKGMSTLSFMDYAVLISDSKESIPLYEME